MIIFATQIRYEIFLSKKCHEHVSCVTFENFNLLFRSVRTWKELLPKKHVGFRAIHHPMRCHGTLQGRGLLKSHGLSETPIVGRNTSDTFTPRTGYILILSVYTYQRVFSLQ